MVILARLLPPSDFGLMAILLVLLGFSHCISDMGLGQALIFQKILKPGVFSTILLLTFLMGGGLTLGIFFLSDSISKLFNSPESASYIRIISPIFLVIAAGQPFLATFQKELNFSLITKAEIIGSVLALCVSVSAAATGFGVYALILGQYILTTTKTGIAIWFGFNKVSQLPDLRFSQIKTMLRFGLFQMGERFVGFTNTNLDKMLISRWLGVLSLGQYSVVFQLMSRPVFLFTTILNRVSFPVLSKIQDNKEKLRNAYLQSMQVTAFLLIPFYATLMVLSQPLIETILGESWVSSHLVFRVLCLVGLFMGLASLTSPLLLALGRADVGFWITILLVAINTFSIWLGSVWGIVGVSWGLALTQFFVLTFIDTYLIWRFIQLSPIRLFKTIFPPVAVTFVICGLLVVFLKGWNAMGWAAAPLALLAGCLFTMAGYGLLSLWVQPKGLKALLEFLPRRKSEPHA